MDKPIDLTEYEPDDDGLVNINVSLTPDQIIMLIEKYGLNCINIQITK
jgi:hypothetical protein